jgi:hypothetical protein
LFFFDARYAATKLLRILPASPDALSALFWLQNWRRNFDLLHLYINSIVRGPRCTVPITAEGGEADTSQRGRKMRVIQKEKSHHSAPLEEQWPVRRRTQSSNGALPAPRGDGRLTI